MKYIVLTPSQKANLKTAIVNKMKTTKYKTWSNYVKVTREDFTPIEIKNDLWILPTAVTDNKVFEKVKDWLILKGVTVREVAQNEFFERII